MGCKLGGKRPSCEACRYRGAEYPARVNKVLSSTWVAAKQLMQFAEPSDTLFRTAFQGVDVGAYLYAVQIRPSCR